MNRTERRRRQRALNRRRIPDHLRRVRPCSGKDCDQRGVFVVTDNGEKPVLLCADHHLELGERISETLARDGQLAEATRGRKDWRADSLDELRVMRRVGILRDFDVSPELLDELGGGDG